MNHHPSSHQRRGPQIYVHVEFGVSWSAKAPKNHEVTYRSRGLRERSPVFPRQVPAPTTNYLAAIHDFQQRQDSRRRHHERHQHHQHHHQHHQQQQQQQDRALPRGQHEARAERGRPAQPDDDRGMLRTTRAESRSSHERGHSAPPPFGENPWDVNVARQEAALYSIDSTMPSQPPQVWKALPAVPSQFRLGEDGMPWSMWPGGEPDAYPQDEEDISAVESRRGQPRMSVFDPSPSMVSVFSPGPIQERNRDPEKVRDLEALSIAMMTVDNGFENQWWNQGQRESTTARREEPTLSSPIQRLSAASLGWAVATTPAQPSREDRLSLAAADLISPASDYDQSPPPFYNLQRTMSTRSEELFFSERGHHSPMAA